MTTFYEAVKIDFANEKLDVTDFVLNTGFDDDPDSDSDPEIKGSDVSERLPTVPNSPTVIR